MSDTLAAVASDPDRVADLEPDSIPALIGEAEALRARLWAALQAVQAPAPAPAKEAAPDRLLTVKEAADRLGVDKRWMYRHADSLPFTKRLSAGTLRFSEKGLARWQDRR